ncbi:ATP-binding protein [Nonomuraea sp. NPDC050783]|uniref:ATP-binding protein n=1 Tax=Nonomuraea sp. NPDC050783 TaxID=3154634 RepID=UPI0034672ABC
MEDDPPPAVLLAMTFTLDEVPAVRHRVARTAASAGLSRRRVDDLVMAVNEGLANAAGHGGGLAQVRLWRADGYLRCRITDQGTGIPDAVLAHRSPLGPPAGAGWGLWMMRRLSDGMAIRTGPEGTSVRLDFAVHGRPPAG